MADDKRLDDLRKQVGDEVRRQEKERADIKRVQEQLRDLRQKHASLVEERKANEESIRELQTELFEDKQIARDSSLDQGVRDAAKERIEESNITITGIRRDMSKQNRSLASYRTGIQKQLSNRERSEGNLSASRSNQRDLQSRSRVLEEAESFTPEMLQSRLSKGLNRDVGLKGLRAAAGIRKGGGSSSEQRDVQQATVEFQNLFASIKELKKSLSQMTEGTEEYNKAQADLTEKQGKAGEALNKIQKINNDVERRRLSQDAPSAGRVGGSAIAGAAGFAGDMFDRLGGMATQRYVLEEQKKQAQFGLQNMASTDLRNRANDATSFLSTGGGKLFGGEMPFGRNGGTTAGIRNLGQDYADTREGAVQYGVGARAIERLARAGVNVAGETAKGQGVNPFTGGIGSFAGSMMQQFGGAGLDIGKEFMLTPEMAGRFGGDKMMKGMSGFVGDSVNSLGSITTGVGADMVSKGGGNSDLFTQGGLGVTRGANSLATAGLKLGQRAYEANGVNNELISTEQQQAQAQRVRERLSMAFAPAMQRYMDIQGSQGEIGRSRVMSRAEREAQERQGEAFSQDRELGERGFGAEDILGQSSRMSRLFGRFGAGGMNERSSKSALMAESMGLGSAEQSGAAMGRMLQGGAKDPEALFTKAVKEGLQKGLQDSRDFQGLLAAASATSESVTDFEGTLSGILKFGGSGRATDVATSSAAFKGINDMMSGQTGGWEDMVKFNITNQAAKGVIGSKAGGSLDREDRTSLQNLANFSPADLQNKELVKNALTPRALKAVEDQEGGLDAFIERLGTSFRAEASTINAINSTQSEELALVKNMLSKGDKEGLKQMFSGPGGKERLQKIYSQILSGNKSKMGTNAAIGTAQGVMNQIGEATGISTKGIGMQQDFTPKTLEGVAGESAAANTMSEQQRRANAAISQEDVGFATRNVRGPNGENLAAADLNDTRERYTADQQRRVDTIGKSQTVNPDAKVGRMDQAVDEIIKGLSDMKEAFKNFSGKDFVVNAGKDVVIQGAAAIKGVILGDGLSAAATKAGESIADAVKDAIGTSVARPGPVNPKSGSSKTNPTPLGQ